MRTTVCQKAPSDFIEAISKFIIHVEERRKAVKFSRIFAMDETAVWFDNPANRTLETKGAKDVTAAGNPKAPSLETLLDWIYRAWEEVSKELILKSFEVGGLTTAVDGTQDEQIGCFKPDGPIGIKGLEVLRMFRAQSLGEDGISDTEELFEDQAQADFDTVADDEELTIEDDEEEDEEI